jgi:hypothetical protein
MQTGAETDIITGRPKRLADEERENQARVQEEALLRKKAEFLGTSDTEVAARLIEIIRARLDARIETLLKADPEATALIGILKDIGQKEHAARQAMDKLMKGWLMKK